MKTVVVAFVCWLTGLLVALADYHLQRITPILNQPTFVTQAPGDPTNILYYTTRITTTNAGFSTANSMGKVWRYNVNTRTSVEVLNFTNRSVFEDTGLQTIAFHPQFNEIGSSNYGKMYTSTSQQGSVARNRVEEFLLLNMNGTFKTPAQVAATARLILRYDNQRFNNHTINWIGFDPTATGAAVNYLYISTGDGAFGNPYDAGIGRPSQNTNDLKGKFLCVDISGGDFYPADTNRNYAIPPTNPFLEFPQTRPWAALPEIFLTGIRNAYRASFDRANGDLYWGDVGEGAWEEVNFLKAGSNLTAPANDFGWPQWEGVHESNISGAPHTGTNPFTLAVSIRPIREYPQTEGAVIGGHVYRGPIAELQGKYFYADFVLSKIWMLDFNRDTLVGNFNGANGTLTDVTALWNSRIYDPTNSAYAGDTNLTTLNGLDHIVSFGEDNEGNLYLVDFGYGTGFSGQYTVNRGEIFKLVPGPLPAPPLVWTNLGSSIRFTWQSSNFKLQRQTNSVSAGIGTNWVDYAGGGTNPVTVPIGPAPAAYFRITPK
jgi:glucose/arabinose dehydrogenase